jgi:hypothetical protein
MRVPQPRAFLCAAVLVAAPLACTKNTRTTNVKIADGEQGRAAGDGARDPGAAGRPKPRANLQKINFSGSVFGVRDMLDAASQLITMWSPPEPGAPPLDLFGFMKVALVQQGFGPGFLESIDLDAVHAGQFAFPHDGQTGTTTADVELRLAFSAHQPVRAIESLPAEMRPQPIGQDVWQLIEDDLQLLFRAKSDSLEIAMSMPDLDIASTLRSQVAAGPNDPRINWSVTNLPRGEIDVTDIIPLPPPLARPLSSILNETSAIDFAADFGTNRDLLGRVGAAAPFSRLGLDPIGPATQTPSALAKALPSEAMLVWLMPWGDPAMLHQMLDTRIPLNQIPAPFDGYVGAVVKSMHGILGQVRGEVLVAVYLDSKGQMTMAFAAEIGDEKATQASMRELFGATEKAFKDHIALAGKSPDHAYTVGFKQGAVTAGKAKADLFTLTVPKSKQGDLAGAEWFVGTKPKLEVSTLVANGKLIVAVGAGQAKFMTEVGRLLGKPGEGLEAGGGLALARKVADGCQYCVAIDPKELGEMVFTVYATDPNEPEEVHKAAKLALAKLAKLELDGQMALALRLDKDRGVLGFGIPKSLLFADPAKVKTLVELMDSLDAARQEAWAKSVGGVAKKGG